MLIEELYNGIIYYKNVIDNPAKFINKIEEIDLYCNKYKNISNWEAWYASTDNQIQYGYSKDGIFSVVSAINEKDFDILEISSVINNIVNFTISNYCARYNIKKPWLPDYFSIKKYIPGADMGPHVDSSDPTDINHPIISGVIYLNDDYEGGEIKFPNQNITIKPEAGSVIVFPSYDPYLHHPQKIIKGNKYMVPLFWYKESF